MGNASPVPRWSAGLTCFWRSQGPNLHNQVGTVQHNQACPALIPVPTSLKNSISSCILAPAYSSNTLAALSSRRRRLMRTCK